jgi:peroxiredoxin
MLSRSAFLGLSAAGLASLALPARAAQVGSAAPGFALTDTNGRSVNLADYRGKLVVLEWTNHDCPFVRKHYNSGNMQALQKKWTDQGVVWLTLISSAPGTQGHVSPQQAVQLTTSRKAVPTAVLFDPKGGTGQAYAATVTPHMYVISPQGTLLYMGGIDDKPTTRLEDVKTAKPYVDIALQEIAAGKPVSTPVTRAYGCTIKYAM